MTNGHLVTRLALTRLIALDLALSLSINSVERKNSRQATELELEEDRGSPMNVLCRLGVFVESSRRDSLYTHSPISLPAKSVLQATINTDTSSTHTSSVSHYPT
jgi:hypothetical protein